MGPSRESDVVSRELLEKYGEERRQRVIHGVARRIAIKYLLPTPDLGDEHAQKLPD